MVTLVFHLQLVAACWLSCPLNVPGDCFLCSAPLASASGSVSLILPSARAPASLPSSLIPVVPPPLSFTLSPSWPNPSLPHILAEFPKPTRRVCRHLASLPLRNLHGLASHGLGNLSVSALTHFLYSQMPNSVLWSARSCRAHLFRVWAGHSLSSNHGRS